MIKITVDGVEYPCYPTLGAMLRYKQETGREATELDPSSISDLAVYLWCCVVSASRREKVKFTLSVMDFADALSPDDLRRWGEAVAEGAEDKPEPEGEEDEKKSPSPSANS